MPMGRRVIGRTAGGAVGVLAVAVLDLAWPVYGAIAAACAVVVAVAGGLEAAVVSGWCGAAVAALAVLVAEVAVGDPLSSPTRLCITGVSVMAVAVVWRSAGLHDFVRRHVTTADRGVIALALAWVMTWAPRSSLGAMGLLYPEDNQKWMMSVAAELRGADESVAVPLGSVNVQYFVRFIMGVLTLPTRLGRDAGDVAGLTLRTQANGWMLCLATILIVTPVVVRAGLRLVGADVRGPIVTAAALLCAIFAFGQAQSVGHFTQFQLSAVVLVAMVPLVFLASNGAGHRRVLASSIAVPVALAIGGSYNPWLPVGLVCAAALVVVAHRDAVARASRTMVGRVGALVVGSMGLVVSLRLFDRFASDLDMEGGVSTVHVEALLVFAALSVSVIVAYLAGRRRVVAVNPRDPVAGAISVPVPASQWTDAGRLGLSLAPVAAAVLGADESTLVAVSSVSLLGLALDRIAGWTRVGVLRSRRWTPTLLVVGAVPLAAVAWAALIWLASRYASDVRAPRFAAWKSIVAVIGQFGWIPVAALLATRWSARRPVRWTVAVGATVALFCAFGFRGRVGEHYVQAKWWHAPVLGELRRDPMAVVVCVSGEVGWPDYETYTCNRYLQTLGVHEGLNGTFRYVAWYRTEQIEAARRALLDMRPPAITVVSPGSPGQSWREYFASTGIRDIRYLEGRQ